jgi:hypothetical protein
MADGQSVEPGEKGDGMDRVERLSGYTLGEGRRMKDVLESEADLLRSEGIDPTWPGFDDDADGRRRRRKQGRS